MDYQEYIRPELLILIPVLYLIGMGLKKSRIRDKWIPLLIGVVSVALSALWIIANGDADTLKKLASAVFMAVTQGILIAGASVYANQIFKQAGKEEGDG